ncbi:MAG TPA: hypothetical protein VG939_13480 [Caulobacteraceae bacterium]|nr:hypothetical protein [Caulobacteraceae bacterium]
MPVLMAIAATVLLAGAAAPHFAPLPANAETFVRMPKDPDAATIRRDVAAIAALKADVDPVIEVMVSYDGDGPSPAWRAERDLEPRFEAILASRGAHARLVATSFTHYKREYWFAPDDDVALVTAFRALPQPPGAAIAVLRSNLDALKALAPGPGERAAAHRRSPARR